MTTPTEPSLKSKFFSRLNHLPNGQNLLPFLLQLSLRKALEFAEKTLSKVDVKSQSEVEIEWEDESTPVSIPQSRGEKVASEIKEKLHQLKEQN